VTRLVAGSSNVPGLHVVAGIIEDDRGRVLLSQRAEDGEHPGLWEFPGGKVESGEHARVALRRELREELGIDAAPSRRVHCVHWREPNRLLLLDGWRVAVRNGTPQGLLGQALRWVALDGLRALRMPPADGPLCSALQLDEVMWITPELDPHGGWVGWLAAVEARLRAGVRLVQLRLPNVDRELLYRAAGLLAAGCRTRGARWVLNGCVEDAVALGAHGVHLSARALRQCGARPDHPDLLAGASCHDAEELAHAAQVGLDYAVLSPLRATPTHPDAEALGDAKFATLVRDCPLPVFALGGVGTSDLEHVQALGAFGVAGIRGV